MQPRPRYPNAWPDEPLLPEGTQMAEGELCVICEQRRIATVTQCGHMYSCVACILRAKPTECATCRAPLESVIRVYR